MAENKNNVQQIRDYLGSDTKEFMDVWKSMTDEEKEEWRTADLSK